MSRPATDRLRILHVSEVHWGGVVTLLRHFTAEQVRSGHEVHVLSPPGLGTLDPGVRFHAWDFDRSRPLSAVGALRELRHEARLLRPDVVHLHSFLAGALGRVPLAHGLDGGAPVVYQPHAWSDQLSTRPGAGWAVRHSERVFARRTHLLVANCEDELSRGRRFGVDVPGRSLGVTVDLERFRPPTADERAAARARLGIEPHRKLVLVLGRLAWQKGQDALLPAWTARPPGDATLALVGPGDQEAYADLAGDELGRSVLLAGESTDVVPWLWAADVMALSSRYETVALVVAEAMATALPVVAAEVDGVREVLCPDHDDHAGAVVPQGDMASLVEEIARRLDDEGLRCSEAETGRRRARTLFAPEAVAERLEAAYRLAVSRLEEKRR